MYSIAPFCYARPFEQIRNDVCINRLPVRLVGNGGGYAYGPMGATHHALEDYGVLLSLPGMRAYIPAFATDIEPMVRSLSERAGPLTCVSAARNWKMRARCRPTHRGADCRTEKPG